MSGAKFLSVNALRIEQQKKTPIFVFGLNGRLISHVASVSYANRSEDGILNGYQRNPVIAHIKSIETYLSSPDALLPNAIVLAFEPSVKFRPLPGAQYSEWGTFGTLDIPLPQSGSDIKPAWIVDGQQRATALSKLDPKKHFPVVVVAFQSGSRMLQREQFVLVNKTKPLPKDLLHEILPEIAAPLSRDLEKRQVAAKVLKVLRFDKESPFYGRVRGLGNQENEAANISQSAVLAVIQNSIKWRGALFNHSDGLNKNHDIQAMAMVMMAFFEGVRRTWPKAWEANPKTSRLIHGVGIVAVGALMDRVMIDVDAESNWASARVANRLTKIKQACAWTKGRWPVLRCSWNQLQNTSQDKARLTEYLLKTYASCR
jgi:DGQHR domain-containing protein